MQNNDFIEKSDEKTQDTFKTIVVDDKEDWKWPCFEEFYNEWTDKMERKVMIESINIDPFVVIYPRDGNPYVELSSQFLIKILRNVLPKFNKKLEDNDNDKPTINARDLFHALEKLRDAV
ncbi:1810_t:CDS:1, partial [Scutellospora calospora]